MTPDIVSSHLLTGYQLPRLTICEPRSYLNSRVTPKKEAEIFAFLIRQNPNDFLSLYYEGDALQRLNLADSGMRCIERSYALNPRFFPSVIALAHYTNKNKEYARALEFYRKAEVLRPRDKDLLFQLGECLRKVGMLTDAVTYFKKASAMDSTNALIHAQLGFAYFTLGRFDSSITEYETAIVFDEDNIQYFNNLARAYDAKDSLEGVIRTYKRAIAILHPENISYAHNNLAVYYIRKCMYAEAADAFDHVYEFNPANRSALRWRAEALAKIPDIKAAISAYERLLRLVEAEPSNLREQTDVKKAIDYYKHLKK